MLEGNKHSVPSMKAQSRYYSDFKIKRQRFVLAPISYTQPVSYLALGKDLESCLNHIAISVPEKYGLDFSLPILNLKPFDLIETSKIVSGNINFSNLLTCDIELFRNSCVAFMESNNLAIEQLKKNEYYGVGDLNQFGYAKLEKIVVSDSLLKRGATYMSRMLNKICASSQYAQGAESLLTFANRMRIRMIPEIFATSPFPPKGFLGYEPKLSSGESLCVSKALSQQMMEEFENPPFNSMRDLQDRIKEINDFLGINDSGAYGDRVKQRTTKKIKNESLSVTEMTELRLDNYPIGIQYINIEAKLRKLSKLIEPAVIMETGVKIFSKSVKLFELDCADIWKKRGEGQIEIWKQPNSGSCYLLVWDKNTGDLMVHMHLDGKWNIDYLPGSINSCRWAYYNYASCPKGIQQTLSCQFEDSNSAAEFMTIVAKCMKSPTSA